MECYGIIYIMRIEVSTNSKELINGCNPLLHTCSNSLVTHLEVENVNHAWGWSIDLDLDWDITLLPTLLVPLTLIYDLHLTSHQLVPLLDLSLKIVYQDPPCHLLPFWVIYECCLDQRTSITLEGLSFAIR